MWIVMKSQVERGQRSDVAYLQLLRVTLQYSQVGSILRSAKSGCPGGPGGPFLVLGFLADLVLTGLFLNEVGR